MAVFRLLYSVITPCEAKANALPIVHSLWTHFAFHVLNRDRTKWYRVLMGAYCLGTVMLRITRAPPEVLGWSGAFPHALALPHELSPRPDSSKNTERQRLERSSNTRSLIS